MIDNNCCICYNEMTDKNITVFDCDHKIHLNCFAGILRSQNEPKCPLCRLELDDFNGITDVQINIQIENDSDIEDDSNNEYEIEEEFMDLRITLYKSGEIKLIIALLMLIIFWKL